MKKHISLYFMLFSLFILLSGCERDLLSQQGKKQLPVDNRTVKDSSAKETVASVKQAEEKQAEEKIVEAKKSDEAASERVSEISWDNLIPDEWRPDKNLVDKYNNGELNDDDPRIIALKEKIKELEEKAPVNNALDGKKIKIPGFVVPVEMDDKLVREFLLVPYQGACIHVPPPPANQTIYVKTDDKSAGEYGYFDTVWVTGTIKVVKSVNELAESGYTILASGVEPYE